MLPNLGMFAWIWRASRESPLPEQEGETPENRAPDLSGWVSVLRKSKVVGEPGDFRPLVLDQASRLYLYRYWQYERQVAHALREFATSDLFDFDPTLLERGSPDYFLRKEEKDWTGKGWPRLPRFCEGFHW